MDYRIKLVLQKVISSLPQREKFNYIFQRYISHTIPINDKLYISKLRAGLSHFYSYMRYNSTNKDLSECAYYEFGAGWDLTFPLLMSVLGFDKIYCLDIRELVFPYILILSISRLKYLKQLGVGYDIPKSFKIQKGNYIQILKNEFGIDYMAPKDARETPFSDSSIDFIISHATLEHIPQKDIELIMKECYRVIKPGGVLSFEIDYSDHYSYFDKNLNEYNFLKYSKRRYKYYNTKLLYQNRLRHKDYIKIFIDTGFEIIEETKNGGDEEDKVKISSIEIDLDYKKNYTIEELMIKSSRIVLTKKS